MMVSFSPFGLVHKMNALVHHGNSNNKSDDDDDDDEKNFGLPNYPTIWHENEEPGRDTRSSKTYFHIRVGIRLDEQRMLFLELEIEDHDSPVGNLPMQCHYNDDGYPVYHHDGTTNEERKEQEVPALILHNDKNRLCQRAWIGLPTAAVAGRSANHNLDDNNNNNKSDDDDDNHEHCRHNKDNVISPTGSVPRSDPITSLSRRIHTGCGTVSDDCIDDNDGDGTNKDNYLETNHGCTDSLSKSNSTDVPIGSGVQDHQPEQLRRQQGQRQRRPRSVSFGSVHVREHERILGDQPKWCDLGGVLTSSLDWVYHDHESLTVDEHKTKRGPLNRILSPSFERQRSEVALSIMFDPSVFTEQGRSRDYSRRPVSRGVASNNNYHSNSGWFLDM